jgi:hypothetical protein
MVVALFSAGGRSTPWPTLWRPHGAAQRSPLSPPRRSFRAQATPRAPSAVDLRPCDGPRAAGVRQRGAGPSTARCAGGVRSAGSGVLYGWWRRRRRERQGNPVMGALMTASIHRAVSSPGARTSPPRSRVAHDARMTPVAVRTGRCTTTRVRCLLRSAMTRCHSRCRLARRRPGPARE